MVRKRRAQLFALTFLLFYQGNISYGQDVGSVQDRSLSMRLLYWYHPHITDQVERLATLRALAERNISPIRVQVIVPPVVPVFETEIDPAIPASSANRLGRGDYAVLLNRSGRVWAQGDGDHVENIMRSLAGGSISTDVDESTWGKIKELFQ